MSETTDPGTPSPTATLPPPPARPALVRSRSDRKVAGVCGGIAAYLGIDPLILRIVVVVLTIFGGSGLLLYAAGWLLIPDEGQQFSEIERLIGRDRQRGPSVGAIIVTVIGLIVLVTSLSVGAAFGHGWWLGGPDLWPLVVVGAIVALVWYARRDNHAPVPSGAPASYTAPAPYPAPAAQSPKSSQAPGTPMASSGPGTDAPTLVDVPVGMGSAAVAVGSGGAGGAPPTASWELPPQPQPEPPKPPKPPKQRSALGALTWWVLLVAAGVMWLLDRTTSLHVTATTFVAVLLGIVGLGLVVGAFVGRSRGLVALGIILSLATATVALMPSVGHARTGTVTWTPTSVSAVPTDGYQLAAGRSTLDLTTTSIDSAREVHVQQGAGRLVVLVPQSAHVVLDATVGAGQVRGPDGREDDGLASSLTGDFGTATGPTLTLRLELGVGSMEVRYA